MFSSAGKLTGFSSVLVATGTVASLRAKFYFQKWVVGCACYFMLITCSTFDVLPKSAFIQSPELSASWFFKNKFFPKFIAVIFVSHSFLRDSST